ncbi:gliding motility lipoprotein GldD [Sporocytophaga sp.]|uniref:gliding motility lipoprotein GldD n=1 Tax=Sporocytophaga sp. TaxID=2231183 RepID=UPI0025F96F30|nr:gliding motility lipoprotein GldD [Sporocytophaga sp.]
MRLMKQAAKILSVIVSVAALNSCTDQEEYTPKPKGYNRIDLPKAEYVKLTEDHPYTFEISKFAEVLKDTSPLAEPHWIDVYYPEYKCNVQITYKPLHNNKQTLNELFSDAHRLKGGHQKKATSIDELVTKTDNGKYVTYFELEGEVPSQFQFYVTDSTKHFLRGALYFRTATKNDSLSPVIEYMKNDIVHMMNTLEWKN